MLRFQRTVRWQERMWLPCPTCEITRGFLFERKAHPGMYDTILRRAAEEEIVVPGEQKSSRRKMRRNLFLRILASHC